MQSLLGRASWSADALRDVVREYALEALGDPDGVLIVDETGFVKKGAAPIMDEEQASKATSQDAIAARNPRTFSRGNFRFRSSRPSPSTACRIAPSVMVSAVSCSSTSASRKRIRPPLMNHK